MIYSVCFIAHARSIFLDRSLLIGVTPADESPNRKSMISPDLTCSAAPTCNKAIHDHRLLVCLRGKSDVLLALGGAGRRPRENFQVLLHVVLCF